MLNCAAIFSFGYTKTVVVASPLASISHHGTLDLQVHRADMRLQGAGRPEGDAGTVLARVIPALLVHRLDVRPQGALRPASAWAVGARVVPALLVHRLDVCLQALLRLVGDAGAVRACVLAQLQVHQVDVPVRMT